MKEKYDAGQLVDDEIIIPLMEERLFHSTDTQHGGQFILDGFPRNLQQAQQFDRMMSKHSSSLATVLNLQLRSDILVQKACMRRTCPRCGEGYNLAHIIEPENGIFMPALAPKKVHVY